MTRRPTHTAWGLATSAGHRRRRNEDACLPGPQWYIVADGMGGHDDGDVASQLVVEILRSLPLDPIAIEASITAAIDAANDAVRREADRCRSPGMGTTVVGLVADIAAGPTVFHVGDSRCYRMVDGELQLLTRDHTHVQELVDGNRLTAEQAARHPLRHVITRAVGLDPTVTADISTLDRRPSRFLLCTDGLTGEVGPRTIGKVLAGIPDPQRAADRLLELALQGPATDNLTAMVVDVVPMRQNGPDHT